MMSPAGSEHGLIALRIGSALLDFVESHALGVVLGAETGFQISQKSTDTLSGGELLPGFSAAVARFFAS